MKSIFFYLRLHPALFKEKVDSDKQFKNINDTDASIEWRQYCLDPLCTNYNQIIQNMFKNGSNLNINQSFSNQLPNTNHVYQGLAPPSLAFLSRFANANQSSSMLSSHPSISSHQASLSNLTQLSPSYVFANTNRNTS